MAEQFASALVLATNAVLHAVVSHTRSRAENFAAHFKVRHAYQNYEQFLNDSAIDVVYIATLNEHHHQDSIAAINAGKAVLCEKPFALNAGQGREVVMSARRRGVFCMEAMWMRCAPAFDEIRQIARGGMLGEITFISAQFGVVVQFDPSHRVYVKSGGGALSDLGVYPVSFVHALIGKPTRIKALASLAPTGVDEQFTADLLYDSGCNAMISASFKAPFARTACIYGTNGSLEVVGPLYFPDGYDLDVRTNSRIKATPVNIWSRLLRHSPKLGHVRKVTCHSAAEGYACEAAVVQRCLTAGSLESSEMPLDDTIEVLEVMDAIRNQWSEQSKDHALRDRGLRICG